MPDTFDGFPQDFFAFLRQLKANNNRAWFEDNKQRFRESVQAPMAAFIGAMAPRLRKISKNFVADPRPSGGSMFRIYRDVRFSKDKRPYKEHAACHFRHALGKNVHAPGYYVHFASDEVFFGGGMWMPPSDALQKVRDHIVRKPSAWKAIRSDKNFAKSFDDIDGDALSRAPRGYDPEHPLVADIKKKSFFAMHVSSEKEARGHDLIDKVSDIFSAAAPLMKFLCNAQGVPY